MVEHALANFVPERPADVLPYDLDDWERRLAVARAQREIVLRERAEAQAAPPEPAAWVEAHGEDALRPPGFAVPPQRAILLRAPARSPAPPRRAWPPFLVGVAIGGAVGASLVGFAVIRTSPAQNAPPSVATAAAVPRASLAAPVMTVHLIAAHSAASAPLASARIGPVPIVDARVLTPAPGPALAAPVVEHPPTVSVAASAAPPFLRSDAAVLVAPMARPVDAGLAPRAGGGATKVAPDATAPRPIQSPAPDAGAFAEVAPQPVPPSATGRAAWADAPADGLSTRVGVHLPAAYASEARDRVLLRLAELGWPTVEVATPYTIAQTHVRYYHAADRQAAEALAVRIGGTARDFTRFSPPPAKGYVEVWLGSAKGAAPFDPVAAPVAPATQQSGLLGGEEGGIAPVSMPPGGVEVGKWHSRRLKAGAIAQRAAPS